MAQPAVRRTREVTWNRMLRGTIPDGTPIRHSIPLSGVGDMSIREGVYIAATHTIWYNRRHYSLNQFAKEHYQDMRPNRVPNVNAWIECKCLIDDTYVAINTYRRRI
jgi:hypothetical protein